MLLRVYSNRFLRNHTRLVVPRVFPENFSLSTKSNLMHIAPWSEDDLRQLSNCIHIYTQPKPHRINFKTSANVLKCLELLTLFIEQIRKVNATQHNSTNAHSYKVVMYIQKLHHFCNKSSPDDGLKLGGKY